MKLRLVPLLAMTVGIRRGMVCHRTAGPRALGCVLRRRDATLAEGEAVMALVAWSVVFVVAANAVLSTAMSLWRSRFARHPSARASLFLVAGLLLLVVSAINRSLPAASVCCGSGHGAIREAIQLADDRRTTHAIVVLLDDDAYADALARMLGDLSADEAQTVVGLPPVRGRSFFADATVQRQLDAWWAARIPSSIDTGFRGGPSPRPCAVVGGLDASCYVGVRSEAERLHV